MLPHAILSLIFLSGVLGRPGWVVLVGTLALTIASLEYVQARAGTLQAAANDDAHRRSIARSIANNAGDSLAYCTVSYLAGWLIGSLTGWIPAA